MKFFYSTMPGAPVLTNAAGSLISLLNACLVDGWGLKAVTTLVVASGVATLTTTGTHGAVVGSTVFVDGATPAGLNGDKVVTGITATTVSFATVLADQTATGTITFKMSALGWTKPFVGTNLATYRASATLATKLYLRIDDTNALTARAVGYESMTAVSSGTAAFPTSAQMSGGLYWPKSDGIGGGARKWFIFGDDQGFYFCPTPGNNTAGTYIPNNSSVLFFGDINSKKGVDAYRCVISGHNFNAMAGSGYSDFNDGWGCLGYSDRNSGRLTTYVARSHTASGTSQVAQRTGAGHIGPNSFALSGNINASGVYGYSYTDFPNNADNGLFFCELMLSANSGIRGTFPGLWHVPQGAVGTTFSSGDLVVATGVLAGKTAFALQVGSSAVVDDRGIVFFNITGPWR